MSTTIWCTMGSTRRSRWKCGRKGTRLRIAVEISRLPRLVVPLLSCGAGLTRLPLGLPSRTYLPRLALLEGRPYWGY
jgi:hypothetical protein